MEQPSAFAAQKAEDTVKHCTFPGFKTFQVSTLLLRLVPNRGDRETLVKKLRNYVTSKRRGRLRLPQYFSAEVRALVDLPKSQIGQLLYWVKPGSALRLPLSKRQYQYVTQLSAVPIWNRWSFEDCHMANSVGQARLGKTDAPVSYRRLWPSAPSFTEMLEMTRRGVPLTSGQKMRPRIVVENHITRKDLSDDIRLASRFVAKMIIGIRSSVRIPEEFLPWFRYRHGFSILSVRYNIPSGLVRFLLAQWKVRHNNLWLLDHCSLKVALRKHTIGDFANGIYRKCGFGPPRPSAGLSRPTTPDPPTPGEEDRVAAIDREFEELLGRLPG